MNLKDLIMPAIATLVLSTGAAAWNANAENDVQNEKIETVQKQHDEAQRAQLKLIEQLQKQNENLAVLTERLTNIQEQLRARPQ